MSREPKESVAGVGRLAPIFLSHEIYAAVPDLFSYSKRFVDKHNAGKLLPHGFGLVSSLWRTDVEGEIKWEVGVESEKALPPHESIAFDSRNSDEFIWDLCYAEAGEQSMVRLIASEIETQGIFARTNNQGSLVDIFTMTPRESFMMGAHLIERLESPEASAVIEAIYERRRVTKRLIVKLINERSVENRKFALDLGSSVDKIYTSRDYNDRIKAHKQQLETTGFPAITLLNPGWLERLNT